MAPTLARLSPGDGPPRLRITTNDPLAMSGRLLAEADRAVIAGCGWNLRRREVLVVPRSGVHLRRVITHLGALGITARPSD